MAANFLNGMTLLLVYQLVGEVSTRLLHLPVPGPVLGMLLLFITLLLHKRVEPVVEAASSALLSHLSLLFVPAGVGVMVHINRMGEAWLPITVALIAGTLITLAVTALVMQGVHRLLAKGAADES
ncbi:CidA/LrgA family protein [Candidatus Thiothrix anitrata]|uniref:CidA/LrgA family protein n=1 Tax=Candidatus Thiothrix anitrata TaxID=2823902 RepID=A0ABX7X409_9GAMM|nr:CidA/LrgA family protein [Candidatus Thiothrix anitrata]QTR50617.1 CidA/LrgA family protein [Candidatus Thiothrix anitrata]